MHNQSVKKQKNNDNLNHAKNNSSFASTFRKQFDNVPNFVKDQIIEFKRIEESYKIIVIAPSVKNIDPQKNENYIHLRYRYFSREWKITIKGILPTVKTILYF